MATDNNVVNLEDNINTRDQKHAAIWLVVLLIVFTAFLVALGLAHAPKSSTGEAAQQQMTAEAGVTPPGGQQAQGFSVNAPVGELELPGTVGEPQNFVLNGHGNTPAAVPAATGTAGASTGSATSSGTNTSTGNGTSTSTSTGSSSGTSSSSSTAGATKPADH